jgi:hypothetical protein
MNQVDIRLRRLDPERRFLLKCVNDPDLVANLQGIDHPKRVPLVPQRRFITPEPNPANGFATSGMRPSAKIVSACAAAHCAAFGNASKSFRAAPIQLTGRVSRASFPNCSQI